MTPEEWQRIKQMVGEALEQPDTKSRLQFLSAACDGDRALQAEIDALLAHASDRLDVVADKMAEVAVDDGTAAIGERLGDYELVREIGRGGMGTIYLARRADEEFEKEVAIKILKRGTDTDEVLRRFRAERQILAQLEHPNIARLIDAGTSPDGLPYFVMEYVDGVPITDFCDAAKLSVRERIELFAKVCGALHFAHQNLVVHRDLKPGNILITANGGPKLLDFGIAKLLSPSGDFLQTTIQSQQRFTPAYASPEQIRGDPVTTGSDIYSLGALLFHLLSGQSPHRFATSQPSPTELFRIIVEEKPARASAVAATLERGRELQGDLDNILNKALRKEPAQRYSSVTEFADDLRRYLEGRPVRARPATLGYRASKFIGRNKLGAAAVLLLLVTLIGGIVATTWQARKAQRRFEQVRKLARAVFFDYHDLIEPLAGSTPVRERLVRDALEYLNNLARDAENDTGLLREVAMAYAKIGQIQGNSYYSNLGDTNGAMQSYRVSLQIREKLLAAAPRDPEFQAETAGSYEGLGDIFYTRGDLRAGLENYERALALRAGAYSARADDAAIGQALALLYVKAGDLRGGEGYQNLGDTAGALASYGKAREILERLIALRPQDALPKANYATALAHGSLLALTTGDAASALRDMRLAVQLAEEIVALDPDHQGSRNELGTARYYLHFALLDNNLITEALELARAMLAEDERLAAVDPKNQLFRRSLGITHNTLGRDLLLTGRATEAIEHHRQALAIAEDALAIDSDSEDSKSDISYSLRYLGRAQAGNGEHAAALSSFRRALALREAKMSADPGNARAREDVALLYQDIGNSLAQSNDPGGAIEAFAKSIPLTEELLRQSPIHAAHKARLAEAFFDAGKVYRQRANSSGPTADDDLRKAREHFVRSLELWQELRDRNALVPAKVAKLQEAERAVAESKVAIQ